MLTGICARSEKEACYVSAKARYSERCVARLDASLSNGHWWTALNGPVFGSSSGIPPLQAPGRGLVSDPVTKAELLALALTANSPAWLLDCRPPVILVLVFIYLPSDPVSFLDCCWTWMGVVVLIPQDFPPLFSGDCIAASSKTKSDFYDLVKSRCVSSTVALSGDYTHTERPIILFGFRVPAYFSHLFCQRSMKNWYPLDYVASWNVLACSPLINTVIGRVWVLVMHYWILSVLVRGSWMVAGSL